MTPSCFLLIFLITLFCQLKQSQGQTLGIFSGGGGVGVLHIRLVAMLVAAPSICAHITHCLHGKGLLAGGAHTLFFICSLGLQPLLGCSHAQLWWLPAFVVQCWGGCGSCARQGQGLPETHVYPSIHTALPKPPNKRKALERSFSLACPPSCPHF